MKHSEEKTQYHTVIDGLTDKLATYFLGSKLPVDVTDTKDDSIIIKANKKIRKVDLRKLAICHGTFSAGVMASPFSGIMTELKEIFKERLEQIKVYEFKLDVQRRNRETAKYKRRVISLGTEVHNLKFSLIDEKNKNSALKKEIEVGKGREEHLQDCWDMGERKIKDRYSCYIKLMKSYLGDLDLSFMDEDLEGFFNDMSKL